MTLRERAFLQLRDKILTGRLAPGAPLSEAELSVELGMSRSPVREALRQLAQEGLVEIFPKRGTFVSVLTAEDIREAFELRDAIEPALARLAAERRTDADLIAMEKACTEIDAATQEEKAYVKATSFHSLVAAAARSRYLQETFEQSTAKINLASRLVAAARPRPPRDIHHRDILEAIAARDAERSELYMRRHLRQYAERAIYASPFTDRRGAASLGRPHADRQPDPSHPR